MFFLRCRDGVRAAEGARVRHADGDRRELRQRYRRLLLRRIHAARPQSQPVDPVPRCGITPAGRRLEPKRHRLSTCVIDRFPHSLIYENRAYR